MYNVHHAISYRFILCRLQGKYCCRQGSFLKHCFRDELLRIKICLPKISTPFLIIVIPFVIIKAEFWHKEYPQNFQTPLGAVTFFNLQENGGNLVWSNFQMMLEKNIENCKFFWYLLLTNSNFLFYLIWYFWRQDIKLDNSMNQKYVSKCIFPLSTRE